MRSLGEKILLIILGVLLLHSEDSVPLCVAAFLCAVIIGMLNHYLNRPVFAVASAACYLVLALIDPVFCAFLPLICYDIVLYGKWQAVLAVLLPLADYWSSRAGIERLVLTVLCLLALLAASGARGLRELTYKVREIRDDGTELNRILEEKNRELMEKQDYEIHLATLKERNRIAREIHDNVGHILSRSLLQIGAVQAVNKDVLLEEPLDSVKQSLNNAMNSIRSSVHDLRDDAVDLEQAVRQMTSAFTDYQIEISYEVEGSISNAIKYCFLSILKEALTNVSRHSDADCIRIVIREHPAMLQILIEDNGSGSGQSDGQGMGLAGMEERVNALGGSFHAGYQDGFRVFASVPK